MLVKVQSSFCVFDSLILQHFQQQLRVIHAEEMVKAWVFRGLIFKGKSVACRAMEETR